MPASLDQISIDKLKGAGPAVQEKCAKIGLNSVQDLLFHLPLRYQDRTRIKSLGELRPGDEVMVEAVIRAADIVKGKRRSLLCRVQDGTGSLTLRFFHFSQAQRVALRAGDSLRAFGEVRVGPNGLEMVHPEYKVLPPDAPPADLTQALTPIYPATEGLTQARLRQLSDQALSMLGRRENALKDWLPAGLLSQYQLCSLEDALAYLHRPPTGISQEHLLSATEPHRQRLVFEELLAHHLSLIKLRQQARIIDAPQLQGNGQLRQAFLQQLPFAMTGAQQRVSEEIGKDLSDPAPMLRLVQGDVGSGKTVVAAMAALQAVECGYQAAIMAPTEILAEQHYANFTRWLEPLGLKVSWLVGKLKGKARAQAMAEIASGEAHVVVGTHALFQDDVAFARLGLAIIDEQHRFGVHQRLSLREKGVSHGKAPHQLIMTATPIPRTLAMVAYADLDVSIIDELPPGRTPVNTVVIADSRRDQVVERVRSACLEGRQAYWVCTLIEESEVLECQAAEATTDQLRELLPELRVGLVHGRMKATEKAAVMAAFKAAELDLLVATTVIEVGVDVPNASVMIIENPERLGLAQLHQLRGRVGRGSVESHCVLMYHAPLSQQGKSRLAVMRDSTDGFVIAEKDLELRGPGEVLGTRQTGLVQFRIANLEVDDHWLDAVHEAGDWVMRKAPEIAEPLIYRWLGQADHYSQA
ncbi:ATP-dependent DNA helicase RecG [Pokkaliibacter sp. CJK22405]|uniref:ATP-dependent DNA helicase RecG n=1 Tax=Pokkaliibacter sp. CJK22405 TaxID=3384615 RepID=UPI003984F50B